MNSTDEVWCVSWWDNDGTERSDLFDTPTKLGDYVRVNATDIGAMRIASTTRGDIAALKVDELSW